ncbi:helix-turn-helix domain-containing protein [Streptococcus parauberis]|uniref:helix-turn-helix domain-containing protein n=1 Tax=Streptococcus parauberis TaxID=1348 RepID=UPI00020CBE62|nr:helix-turn-helix transcriptional regulator [Streptococcus parauberis]AEF24576.1 DNA-binding protein [Streptococcus parauberis KCTC 11537]UWM90383.1 helix-turn-helix domain-containing protein [Streptococcus parauberis]WEM63413.1 helix-turn-helix transcriptional regulator [Streptococcus parauberis]GAJ62412.1 DNA-binding protein [Streptococcus parauberis]
MSQISLKSLRLAKKLTQEQLANKTDISVRTIARYEKDVAVLRRAKYEKLKAIAEVLSVTVDDIFLG